MQALSEEMGADLTIGELNDYTFVHGDGCDEWILGPEGLAVDTAFWA